MRVSKMVTVRLEEKTVEHLEAVRDPQRFPTQSDFIREAIRRMVREERRDRVREEMIALAQDEKAMAEARDLAEAGMEDWIAAIERADRGEL